MDLVARKRTFHIDTEKIYPIYFFVSGEPYKLLGLIPMSIHLFGVDSSSDPEANIFLFGTDRLGRDLFSRIIYGGRISLFIGFAGVFLTLLLGTTLGAMSGYYGGGIDMFVQRTTEFLTAFPREPLFLALAAAIPIDWPSTTVFFMVTILLAFVQWGNLARQVRSLVLSLREREYVLAAQSFGASDKTDYLPTLDPGHHEPCDCHRHFSDSGHDSAGNRPELSWLRPGPAYGQLGGLAAGSVRHPRYSFCALAAISDTLYHHHRLEF
jgi:peptide/nickel transport system permease protein